MPYQLKVENHQNSNFNQTHSISATETPRKSMYEYKIEFQKNQAFYSQTEICTTWMTR